MWDSLWRIAHEESIGILIGAAFALLTAAAAAWWRRRREMREIIHGQQFQQLEFRPLQYVAPTVLLIRKSDLEMFKSFESCRDLLVHHGSDAAKILTLLEVHHKFAQQEQRLAQARAEGRSTQYLEEMWMLDLCLATEIMEPTAEEVTAGTLKPFRHAPWDRFAPALKLLGLENPVPKGSRAA